MQFFIFYYLIILFGIYYSFIVNMSLKKLMNDIRLNIGNLVLL